MLKYLGVQLERFIEVSVEEADLGFILCQRSEARVSRAGHEERDRRTARTETGLC